MTIIKEIIELLHDNDCVILPNFGAFILKNKSAYIKDDEFFPPSKFVSFNQMLSENDGLLYKYISKTKNITYDKASKLVDNEIGELNKKLSSDLIFEIKDLGIFELKENNLIFNPNYSINFNNYSFGLTSFVRKPSAKVIKDSDIHENSLNINYLLRYAAITFVVLGFTYFGYNNYTNYVSNENLKSIADAQNQIKRNIQTATFNLGELPTISIKVNAPVIKANSTNFSVIAGSFRSKNNAQKHLNELLSKGFKASYTSVNPKGLYRVAYARLSTRKDAYILISKIKAKGQDAWLLIEN